jgi:hypothetical protein
VYHCALLTINNAQKMNTSELLMHQLPPASQENQATHVGREAVVTVGDITADNDNPSKALLLEFKICQSLALVEVISCYDRHHQRHLQCQCLAVMRNREDFCEAVGEYQLMSSNLAFVDQKNCD